MSVEDYHDIDLSAEEIEARLLGLVRGDVRQNKSENWKAQARANIGAGQSDSGFIVSGHFDTLQDLIDYYTEIGEAPKVGVAYGIGTTAPYHIYIYDGITYSWLDYGPLDVGDSFIEDNEPSADKAYSGQKVEAELAERDTAIDEKAEIDDAATSSTTTWSSTKISSEIAKKDVRVATVTLVAANWTGSDPYTQTVTLSSGATITANTKVDLQPNAAAIAQLVSDGVSAVYIDNTNGVLTAYAIGAATTANLTIYCTYYEVR